MRTFACNFYYCLLQTFLFISYLFTIYEFAHSYFTKNTHGISGTRLVLQSQILFSKLILWNINLLCSNVCTQENSSLQYSFHFSHARILSTITYKSSFQYQLQLLGTSLTPFLPGESSKCTYSSLGARDLQQA